MDHVVFVDSKSKELGKILSGEKTIIIRGAAGRKIPYGRVFENDVLYFINNNGEGLVKAKANVKNVYNSEKLTPTEAEKLLKELSGKLQLSEKQKEKYSGKRYLVLIEIENIKAVTPFEIDKSNYSNMDDWLLVEKIEPVKKSGILL